MKKIMISLLALLLLAGCTDTCKYRPSANYPDEITEEDSGRIYSAKRLVMVVDKGTDEEAIRKLAARYGMTIRYLMGDGTIAVFESELPFSADDLSKIREEIEQADFVQSAEYDYIIKLDDPVTPPLSDM